MKRWIKIMALAVALMVVLVSIFYVYTQNRSKEEVKVTFFNIGHGLSILVQTPDDRNILIDAGSFYSQKNTSDFLRERDISTIDVMIITHPHPDHVSFGADVVNDFVVKDVIVSGMNDSLEPDTYQNFLSAANDKGCNVIQGSSIGIGSYINLSSKVKFQLIWIDPNSTDENAGCMVFRMTYDDFDMMFMGDANYKSDDKILESGINISADVLQVGHHGVNDSTSQALLDAIHPDAAVISCGYGYGIPPGPQQGVMARLSGITTYLTMFRDAIVITSDGDGYRIDIIDRPVTS